MNKIINQILCLSLILAALVGCSGQRGIKSNRPYVFVDTSGHEYRGLYVQPHMPQSASEKSGHLTVSYAAGQKWIEGSITNGQFHGTVRMWREDGTLFVEENYKRGLKHGTHVWYNPDGTKQFEHNYVDGKRVSTEDLQNNH
jgi:hypothetical protein